MMLDGKFDLNQISSNIVQHHPTSSNIANKRFQHLGSNMLDVVGSNMLEPFALGFINRVFIMFKGDTNNYLCGNQKIKVSTTKFNEEIQFNKRDVLKKSTSHFL